MVLTETGWLEAGPTPDINVVTKSAILNAFLILLALATPLLAQDLPATDAQRDVLDQFLIRFDRISDQGFVKTRLKEPQWADGLKSAQRIHQYGYRDPNGRQAWYLSVTCKVNDAGLQLHLFAMQERVRPKTDAR